MSKKFIPMSRRILGIDPGYGRIGLAVLEKTSREETLLHSECFETEPKLEPSERLLLITKYLGKIIKKFKPNELAIETLLWGENKKTAMQVAEARGALINEAAKKNILIREFNPNQVKLAITGYGKSDKKQIADMVKKLLKLPDKKRYDDEYDAIAIALTCAAISLSTDTF